MEGREPTAVGNCYAGGGLWLASPLACGYMLLQCYSSTTVLTLSLSFYFIVAGPGTVMDGNGMEAV